jgi:antitoxin component YwqK of YwqJK toxin-antitoxin module
MKKMIILFIAVLSVVLFASCTVYVDKPDVYTYSQSAPDFYVMRIYDNRYVFYNADEPVATWIFNDDGTVIKEGVVITGPVRVYYDSGVLFTEAYYRGGIREGIYRNYYPDGTLMMTGNYNAGFRNGMWTSYVSGGGVYGSFDFSVRGSQAPQAFNPQMDDRARAGVDMMAVEEHSAGRQVISRQFNRNDAAPKNFGKTFGAQAPQSGNKTAQGIPPQNKNNGVPVNQGKIQQPRANTANTPAVNTQAVIAPSQNGQMKGSKAAGQNKKGKPGAINPANMQMPGQNAVNAAAANKPANKQPGKKGAMKKQGAPKQGIKNNPGPKPVTDDKKATPDIKKNPDKENRNQTAQ